MLQNNKHIRRKTSTRIKNRNERGLQTSILPTSNTFSARKEKMGANPRRG